MVVSGISLRLVKQSQRCVMPNIILSDTSASVSEL
ncbi:antitoxin, partial [Salmonella enterica subsp. enterica serovar Typhimurium]|nr:antitoxin [Salmonella enterica subsp. enterica serovar Typhimurium]